MFALASAARLRVLNWNVYACADARLGSVVGIRARLIILTKTLKIAPHAAAVHLITLLSVVPFHKASAEVQTTQ